jgi:hypothetical protein
MQTGSEPIVRFFRLIDTGRMPMRADRSAMGTLPVRAVRYCEALTSATAFGWWVFCPIDLDLLWDGSEVFWRYDGLPDWMPLQASAQFPDFAGTFDYAAPGDLKGCSPPFLTALPEPGTVQIWTGLMARTAPDWHLLVRSPPNLPQTGGISLFEGIVQTDHWFGPMFTNLRLTRSHTPIRIRGDYPLIQVQPIHRDCYSQETLDGMVVVPDMTGMGSAEWDAYRTSIAEPNSRPNRNFGAYATGARKRRHANADSAAL